jgi:hypothetical protein
LSFDLARERFVLFSKLGPPASIGGPMPSVCDVAEGIRLLPTTGNVDYFAGERPTNRKVHHLARPARWRDGKRRGQ